MSTEYEIVQKENELLHSQMESVRLFWVFPDVQIREERDEAIAKLEKMKESLAAADERNMSMERELEEALSENM